MWFADKLGSKPQAGAPARKGVGNGKAAPQQAARAPQQQQARGADPRSPSPPAPPKKKGWF